MYAIKKTYKINNIDQTGGVITFADEHHAIYGRVGYANEIDKIQIRVIIIVLITTVNNYMN